LGQGIDQHIGVSKQVIQTKRPASPRAFEFSCESGELTL